MGRRPSGQAGRRAAAAIEVVPAAAGEAGNQRAGKKYPDRNRQAGSGVFDPLACDKSQRRTDMLANSRMPRSNEPQGPADRPVHPYADSLAAAVVAALVAGLAVAAIDIVLASGRGQGGAGALVPVVLGLYAWPALAAGVFAGLVGAAFRATFGDGALGRSWRRLRDDRDTDGRVAAVLLAAGAAAGVYALFAATAARILVADVERQSVGALLLGAVVAMVLPVFAAVGLIAYRAFRPIGRRVPRLGPLPGSAVLLVCALVLGVAAVLWVIFNRLDWRALDLGLYVLVAGFAIAMLAWLVLWRGPITGLRQRLPRRGLLAALAAAVALVLPLLVLRGAPGPQAALLLDEHSSGARTLAGIGRALVDRDGDGFSAFLGGPDCDDGNPNVHPDAQEVFDNGIDDNCVGGDRSRPAEVASDPEPEPDSDFRIAGGNVLVIAIDTLRADRLGIAGYRRDERSLTPRLDRLAGESIWFTRAWAQAPNTPRSFPSMFASLYPSQVKVDKDFANYPQVADENLLLWEVLRDAGLHTTGFSSHFYFTEERGIRQGFAAYDNEGALDIAGSNKDIAAPRIVPRAVQAMEDLAGSGERFAMFVHLFEPHSTYVKHDEFPITERKIPGLIQKYDYEIAYVDRWIGTLLDALEQSGLADDTIVVVMSDHGEAFGGHRVAGQKMFFHGQTLYDELLRVPLLLRVPGVAGQRIDDPVALIDVAPTLTDLLGLESPGDWVGRSLEPLVLGEELPARPVYGELLPAPSWNHAWKMMVTGDGRHKVIYRLSDKRFEVYDLQADDQEQTDLHRDQPELTGTLKDALIEWIEVGLPRP